MTTTAAHDCAVTRELLFTALGFTAIAMQGGPEAGAADRAQAFAALVEAFCRQAVPEAFGDSQTEQAG